MEQSPKTKILFLITKSNFGENENFFSFSPILNEVREQSLTSLARLTVGGPAQLLRDSNLKIYL
jgi:hypothetical protein